MYPTLFTLPFLPEGWGEIRSYGLALCIGFLTGTWLACRRAERMRADPDVVINLGLLSLIFGVIGARLFFVIHYWDSQFANQPQPLLAALRIDRGGLEFWGGPMAAIPVAMAYLWRGGLSVRWYLDIVAPALMWGLAITRIGCFLNGCCWGGVCLDPHDPDRQKPGLPWMVRFPYGSPAMMQQYWFGQLTLPRELISYGTTGESVPVPREYLEQSEFKLRWPLRQVDKARAEVALLRGVGGSPADVEEAKARLASLTKASESAKRLAQYLDTLTETTGLRRSELATLAAHYRSLPVHPTQLYASAGAFLLSWLLGLLCLRRRRHGVVFGWMLVLYSVMRFLLECIRQDNPLDVAQLTLSQSVCVGMFLFGVAYLLVVLRLPLRSPAARPYQPPPEDEPAPLARPAP